jgi:hypothetical protein
MRISEAFVARRRTEKARQTESYAPINTDYSESSERPIDRDRDRTDDE